MTTLSVDGHGHVDKTVGLILTVAGLEGTSVPHCDVVFCYKVD